MPSQHGSLRLVSVFLHFLAQRTGALLQDSLDVVVEHVAVFVQHHVIASAVQLLETQVTRVLIENVLDCILELLPRPAKLGT